MNIYNILNDPIRPPPRLSEPSSWPTPLPPSLRAILKKMPLPPASWTKISNKVVFTVTDEHGITREEDEWCQNFGEAVVARMEQVKEEEWCRGLLVRLLGDAGGLEGIDGTPEEF